MNLTPIQARCIAVIRAMSTPGRDVTAAYFGWMRFLQHDTLPLPAYEERLLLGLEAAHVAERLRRLDSDHGLKKVAVRFSQTRCGSHIDILGRDPTDRAGQMVLIYALTRVGDPRPKFTDIMRCFSIPPGEFGERLLIGELIYRADDDLARVARAAAQEY